MRTPLRGAVALEAIPEDGGVRGIAADFPRELFHAAFDPVGGPSLARSRRATRADGVVASYGLTFAVDEGASRTVGLFRTFAALGRARVTPGARCRFFRVGQDAERSRTNLQSLVELLLRGEIRPQVETLPLVEVGQAHRRLEARDVVGKLVLVP